MHASYFERFTTVVKNVYSNISPILTALVSMMIRSLCNAQLKERQQNRRVSLFISVTHDRQCEKVGQCLHVCVFKET